MLCLITDIKTRLGVGAEFDDILTAIVAGVSSIFDGYCDRTLLAPEETVTLRRMGYGQYLQLPQYPIVEIPSVTEAWDYDFDNADPLVEGTDYMQLDGGAKGVLYRIWGAWPLLPGSVEIVYRGGYLAAGETPEEDSAEVALPADLREAAVQQACLLFKRRDDIGLSSVSALGGSVSVFAQLELLPLVKQTLDRYRRIEI